MSWGFTFFFFFLLLASFLFWDEVDLAFVYIPPVFEEMKKKNLNIIFTPQQYNLNLLYAFAYNPNKQYQTQITTFPKNQYSSQMSPSVPNKNHDIMTVKLQIKVEVTMQFLGGDAVVSHDPHKSQTWDFRVCYI